MLIPSKTSTLNKMVKLVKRSLFLILIFIGVFSTVSGGMSKFSTLLQNFKIPAVRVNSEDEAEGRTILESNTFISSTTNEYMITLLFLLIPLFCVLIGLQGFLLLFTPENNYPTVGGDNGQDFRALRFLP